MDNQRIKELALANGFKLKEQPDGSIDLNPYVYDFALALIGEAGRAGFIAGLELADSPTRGMLSKNDLLCRADEYAAKVRQGGEQ